MKKNETKTVRSKPANVRTREQMEDRAFNHMLVWLVATIVAEAVMLLVNRFYIHARADELGAVPPLYTILVIAPIVGIVLFVVFLVWGLRIRKNEELPQEGMIQFALGAAFLCIGLVGYIMRAYGIAGAPMVLGVIPALGVLMLVFYLYEKEFFGCAIAGGLGILGMWIFRSVAHVSKYYGYMVASLVVIVVGIVLAVVLKKKDGVISVKGKDLPLLQPGAAYLTYFLTAVVSVLILLAPLVLGAAAAYYAIWVMAAWLFILAVYFTSKLM